MPQIDLNETGCFELDFPKGMARFTHLPSGDTCLRHEYMKGFRGTPAWHEKLAEFLGRHPDTHLVVNGRRTIIDDVRNFPISNGGFKVTDLVVTHSRGGDEPDCVREIIASKPNGDPRLRDAGDIDKAFLLDDGQTLAWDPYADGWYVLDRSGRHDVRARKPLPGEDLEDLRIPSDEMVLRAMRDIRRPLETILADQRVESVRREDPVVLGEILARLRGGLEGMTKFEEMLETQVGSRAEPWKYHGRESVPDMTEAAAETLLEKAKLARRLWKLPQAQVAGLHSVAMNLDYVIERTVAVSRTMRARGVLPDVKRAPSFVL